MNKGDKLVCVKSFVGIKEYFRQGEIYEFIKVNRNNNVYISTKAPLAELREQQIKSVLDDN